MTIETTPKLRLASLKVDLKKQAEGDWIPSPTYVGVSYFVRSLNAKSFTTKRDLLRQRLRRENKGVIPEKVEYEELGRLFAEELVLGWKGLDAEYTPDLAIEVMTDREYQNVRTDILTACTEVGQSQIEFVEDAQGNSEGSSGTS